MKQKLLLIEDVDGLGRSGDVVLANAGYVRNFLLPRKKAVIASPYTLRRQNELKAEREKKAVKDKEEALILSSKLVGITLHTEVKVDPEGNMYGSVAAMDIARMLQEQGFNVEKRHIILPMPIKTVGTHEINIRLNEGVAAAVTLEIAAETIVLM